MAEHKRGGVRLDAPSIGPAELALDRCNLCKKRQHLSARLGRQPYRIEGPLLSAGIYNIYNIGDKVFLNFSLVKKIVNPIRGRLVCCGRLS